MAEREGNRQARAARAAAARQESESEFQISLEHGRWRHFSWLAVGSGLGIFLVWKLGTVGKGLGVVLLVLGAVNLVRFARTLLRPAGSIAVSEDSVKLPDGLCRADAHTIEYRGIRHAFFLRRAVPWTRTGPILVIETDRGVFSYPRDWFATDSDQRRIAHAIHRRLGRP
ncbi:MAG TPA: hypothetical protein VFU21_01625 [Kofleriaceae bacterium]|nr:hypothetical protein [Kofleriaceae bacterium]